MTLKTDVKKLNIQKISSAYPFSEFTLLGSFKNGTVQTNLLIQTENRKVVLRLYENRTADQVQFEVDVLRRLTAYNFPSPAPIANKWGDFLGEIDGKPYLLFSYLAGQHISMLNGAQRNDLIKHLAILHKLTRSFTPANVKQRWNYRLEFCWNYAKSSAQKSGRTDLDKKLGWWREQLNRLQIPDEVPLAICHCDLNLNNMLFSGDKLVGLLDFDDANQTWPLFDLANLMDEVLYANGNELDFVKAREMVDQYEVHRQLGNVEIESFFDLFKFQIMMGHLWFFASDDAERFDAKARINLLNRLGRKEFKKKLGLFDLLR